MAPKKAPANAEAKGRSPKTKSDWLASLSFTQHQRFRYFEARLLWEGQVNRQDVCRQFGVTANHFTREVRDYRLYFPQNIWYDISGRTYRPTEKFHAEFASGDPEEYLALLKIYAKTSSQALLVEMGTSAVCEVLDDPICNINRIVLQKIISAIRGKLGCKIKYQSFSTPNVINRIIWPHALVFTGYRWHIRAYDGKRKTFVNLALSRINSVSQEDKSIPNDADVDFDWIETEKLEIIPNPDLSPSQQNIVANEYGMTENSNGYSWIVTLRRCMIPYFLHRYRLDDVWKPGNARYALTHRIIILDHSIIEKHAFPID